MPIPIDIEITYYDNSKKLIYIPLSIMRGEKNFENYNLVDILPDWEWVNESYRLDIDITNKNIKNESMSSSGTGIRAFCKKKVSDSVMLLPGSPSIRSV